MGASPADPSFAFLSAGFFGLAAGLLIGWLFFRGRLRRLSDAGSEWKSRAEADRESLDRARDECAKLAERAAAIPALEEKLSEAQGRVVELSAEAARLSACLDNERTKTGEKVALLEEAREALANQFKSLAGDILEEKGKRFAEQNLDHLGRLLEPLKTRIREFQGKVEEVYVQEGKDRAGLAEQVRRLMELNQALSRDAKNLTSALKGSSKTRGTWGELVLERVLEASGLRSGEEYIVQSSHAREDGSRAQPDVVIRLPEDRNLVVDAKVSLNAYEDYAAAEDEESRQSAVKRHLDSVRNHIRGLSGKSYQSLYGLKSLDFVLMFVPVEPAFLLAVASDRDLFMDAWKRNVLLVSPSTLLFVVRTVAHLWRQEDQNRNAQEIAKRGAELYDKFAGFVEDLESVGERLKQAQRAYDAAHGKMASGRGNLVRQAEMLRELGVKPSKALRPGLTETADSPDPLPSECAGGTDDP
ncbi:MAG: DNA recombination protein RmuC [Deltaproteobacteria bacterium]